MQEVPATAGMNLLGRLDGCATKPAVPTGSLKFTEYHTNTYFGSPRYQLTSYTHLTLERPKITREPTKYAVKGGDYLSRRFASRVSGKPVSRHISNLQTYLAIGDGGRVEVCQDMTARQVQTLNRC